MCQLQILRYICDCQVITAVDPCKYFKHEGFEICSAKRLTSTFVDQISACTSCRAARYDSKVASRYGPVQVLQGQMKQLQERQYNLTKAYEEIGKQYHRVPLGIRNDPRLPESQRRIFTALFHATVSREANSWFTSWHAAERLLALAQVEASRSLSAGQKYYSQAKLQTELAEARLMTARQYVTRMIEVWRLRPNHLNTNGDIIQADIYIRRWLSSLTVS